MKIHPSVVTGAIVARVRGPAKAPPTPFNQGRRTPARGSLPGPVDAFESYVRNGLALAGVEVDELDLNIMRVADAIYGPFLTALASADMTGVAAEPDLQPGRAPAEGQ